MCIRASCIAGSINCSLFSKYAGEKVTHHRSQNRRLLCFLCLSKDMREEIVPQNVCGLEA